MILNIFILFNYSNHFSKMQKSSLKSSLQFNFHAHLLLTPFFLHFRSRHHLTFPLCKFQSQFHLTHAAKFFLLSRSRSHLNNLIMFQFSWLFEARVRNYHKKDKKRAYKFK
jgi:hypothetical protein